MQMCWLAATIVTRMGADRRAGCVARLHVRAIERDPARPGRGPPVKGVSGILYRVFQDTLVWVQTKKASRKPGAHL